MEVENREVLINDNVGRKILDSAMEIINNEGVENLTIRKVAKASGCSNSAIYQRFQDKDELAITLAARQASLFIDTMAETYSKDADLHTNLNNITGKLIKIIFEHGSEEMALQVMYQSGLRISENQFVKLVEDYIKTAMLRGEVSVSDARETAFIFVSSFIGLAQMLRGSSELEADDARKYVERQNLLLYNSIRISGSEDAFWDLLKEKGVDVDKALERMKNNKEAYKSFLSEFFEDPDFESLGTAIERENTKNAFEYAHGLKGMAANLGLDVIHSKLSSLVEILRPGRIEGAMQAYNDVMESCRQITVLL